MSTKGRTGQQPRLSNPSVDPIIHLGRDAMWVMELHSLSQCVSYVMEVEFILVGHVKRGSRWEP